MTVLWLQRIFMQVKKQIHDQNQIHTHEVYYINFGS